MKKYIQILTAFLLLTACNTNTPSALSVHGKIYKHPEKMQYLKFATDSVCYYGDFGNETLNNHTFAYTQKDEVVTVFTPTPEHLLAYEGFVLRGDTIYELFADTSDPSYHDHQPANPATWSPVGKRYATEPFANGRADTLEFFDKATGASFSQQRYEAFTYTLQYPNIELFFGVEGRLGEFQDTARLYYQGFDYFIIK